MRNTEWYRKEYLRIIFRYVTRVIVSCCHDHQKILMISHALSTLFRNSLRDLGKKIEGEANASLSSSTFADTIGGESLGYEGRFEAFEVGGCVTRSSVLVCV